jgi:hypothetical protein
MLDPHLPFRDGVWLSPPSYSDQQTVFFKLCLGFLPASDGKGNGVLTYDTNNIRRSLQKARMMKIPVRKRVSFPRVDGMMECLCRVIVF